MYCSDRLYLHWASWIRTSECRSQSPVPYRLATPLRGDTKRASRIDWHVKKGEWWGSNPRHPEPQSGALPLNYILHIAADKIKARLKGFEPLAHGLEGRCSIRLSYRRTPRGNRSGTLASRNQAREPAAILLTVYNYSGNRAICQYAIALYFRKIRFLTARAGIQPDSRADFVNPACTPAVKARFRGTPARRRCRCGPKWSRD